MDEDQRRQRRAFIRAHHPDHGGDPDAFRAGLRRWDVPHDPPLRVVVVSPPRWPLSWVAAISWPVQKRRRPPRVR